MKTKPSLKEVLRGYKRFNAWESREQAIQLASLSIEESLAHYFQLSHLASLLDIDGNLVSLKPDIAHWIELRRKRELAAGTMGYARAARGIAK